MSRLRRRSGAIPQLLLVTAAACALVFACARKADLSGLDAAGDRLHDLVGAATQALADSDPETLARCRGDLVRLRQETRDLELPASTGELRDTLVVAMDLLVDGLDATAAGVSARSAGEQSVDLVEGRAHLQQATAHLEFGQFRLEKALGTLNRYQDLRARLQGRS